MPPLATVHKPDTRILTLARCREHLGKVAASMTDEQVLEIRDQADQLAEAIFNHWLRRKSRNARADSRRN